MKFLSIYKSVERGVPSTQEEMAKMGELIEQEMKAGTLLATDAAVETSWPSLSFAFRWLQEGRSALHHFF